MLAKKVIVTGKGIGDSSNEGMVHKKIAKLKFHDVLLKPLEN